MGVSRGTESERNADWAGMDIENLIDPSSDTNHEEKGWAMRRTLRRLWDVLAGEAIVELRGCDVASGVRGQVFLTVLANIFEVKVRAGNVTQYGPGLGWAGTVHEARPNSSGTSTFQGQVAF